MRLVNTRTTSCGTNLNRTIMRNLHDKTALNSSSWAHSIHSRISSRKSPKAKLRRPWRSRSLSRLWNIKANRQQLLTRCRALLLLMPLRWPWLSKTVIRSTSISTLRQTTHRILFRAPRAVALCNSLSLPWSHCLRPLVRSPTLRSSSKLKVRDMV